METDGQSGGEPDPEGAEDAAAAPLRGVGIVRQIDEERDAGEAGGGDVRVGAARKPGGVGRGEKESQREKLSAQAAREVGAAKQQTEKERSQCRNQRGKNREGKRENRRVKRHLANDVRAFRRQQLMGAVGGFPGGYRAVENVCADGFGKRIKRGGASRQLRPSALRKGIAVFLGEEQITGAVDARKEVLMRARSGPAEKAQGGRGGQQGRKRTQPFAHERGAPLFSRVSRSRASRRAIRCAIWTMQRSCRVRMRQITKTAQSRNRNAMPAMTEL